MEKAIKLLLKTSLVGIFKKVFPVKQLFGSAALLLGHKKPF